MAQWDKAVVSYTGQRYEPTNGWVDSWIFKRENDNLWHNTIKIRFFFSAKSKSGFGLYFNFNTKTNTYFLSSVHFNILCKFLDKFMMTKLFKFHSLQTPTGTATKCVNYKNMYKSLGRSVSKFHCQNISWSTYLLRKICIVQVIRKVSLSKLM